MRRHCRDSHRKAYEVVIVIWFSVDDDWLSRIGDVPKSNIDTASFPSVLAVSHGGAAACVPCSNTRVCRFGASPRD
jgi:hypothetical protein